MESLLKRSLPPVEELEERLRNGVLLVELGKLFLPGDSLWSRAYDMNESRYRVNSQHNVVVVMCVVACLCTGCVQSRSAVSSSDTPTIP